MFTVSIRKVISCVLKREEERGTAHPPVLPAQPPGDLGCLATAASRASCSSHTSLSHVTAIVPPALTGRRLPFPLLSDENYPTDRDKRRPTAAGRQTCLAG